MNLDLRSQRKNSEVALLIRSRALSQQAARQVNAMIMGGAYHLSLEGGALAWQAPPGSAVPQFAC